MQRNGERAAQAEMRRQAALARPAGEGRVPPGSTGGGIQAGSSDAVTGAWRAAGISNVDSTADGFYSAAG